MQNTTGSLELIKCMFYFDQNFYGVTKILQKLHFAKIILDVNQGKETGLTALCKIEQYDYSPHLMGRIGQLGFVERSPIVLVKETEKGLLHLILQRIHFR